MKLAFDRDLDQHHRSLAPVRVRADPDRWPTLVERARVLVVVELAVALHQAEALRILVHEGRKLQRGRVVQRPPQPVVGAGQHLQPVAVVDGGAVVVGHVPVRGAEPVHRGQRRDPHVVEITPGEQRHAGADAGVFARRDRELVGAGDRRAVQQCPDRHAARVKVRLFDPVFAEDRKLLARGAAGAEREPAARHAIDVAATQDAVIAGPLEHGQLVQDVGPVQRRAQAEPRPAHVAGRLQRGIGRERDRIVGEDAGIEGQRPGRAVFNEVQFHRLGIQHAGREQVEAPAPDLAPRIGLAPEADAAIGIVAQVLEGRGQRRGGLFVVGLRQRGRDRHHVVEPEGAGRGGRIGRGSRALRLGGRRGLRVQPRGTQRGRSQRGGSQGADEYATFHV